MNPKPISMYTFECTILSYLDGFESNNGILNVYLKQDLDELEHLCFPKNLLVEFDFSKDFIYVHVAIL